MVMVGKGDVHFVIWLRGTLNPAEIAGKNGEALITLCGEKLKQFQTIPALNPRYRVCPKCAAALEEFVKLNGHRYRSAYVRATVPLTPAPPTPGHRTIPQRT